MVPSPIPAEPPRRRVMRTYDALVGIGLIGLALGFSPAASFDGTPTEERAKPPAGPSLQSRESTRVPAPGPSPLVAPPNLSVAPAAPGVPRPPGSVPQGGGAAAAAAKRIAPTPG